MSEPKIFIASTDTRTVVFIHETLIRNRPYRGLKIIDLGKTSWLFEFCKDGFQGSQYQGEFRKFEFVNRTLPWKFGKTPTDAVFNEEMMTIAVPQETAPVVKRTRRKKVPPTPSSLALRDARLSEIIKELNSRKKDNMIFTITEDGRLKVLVEYE